MARLLTIVLWGLTTAVSAQVLDTSETRVQTTLDSGWKRIGTLVPRSVPEISGQNWSVGCETLDRGFANFDSYKEYLVPLGIRQIRLQGGWATTEREPGKYDFRWLDRVIDDARKRGLEIWLETSYGNPSYPGGGNRGLGGGFPTSDEALAAWDKWVEAMATRYQGQVRDWGMWNEPDGNRNHTPEMTADFNMRTAAIIKRVLPDARIAGGIICGPKPEWTERYLKRLTEQKQEQLFHWFVYHGYTHNPDKGHYENVAKLKELVRQYAPHLKLWQGEAGTQSEYCLGGALSKYAWTELKQAKWQTRRMLGDLGHDVQSLVFCMADLDYNRQDGYRLGDLDRYGLIKTDKQYRVLKVKPAYYAVQNVVSVFDDTLRRIPDPPCEVQCGTAVACFAYRKQPTGQPLLTLWTKGDVPSDDNTTVKATVVLRQAKFQEPVWVDLITGGIHEIPPALLAIDGDTVTFKDIPLYDAPIVIAERALMLK